MRVVDADRWLRAKRLATGVLAVGSLASMGGLEGDGAVPVYSWLLLACTFLMVGNITRHYR